MQSLVGWLLQTDPNRRPSIDQVLTHPAISSKVKEFQILHPCPTPQRSKAKFTQPKAAPALPVNEKKTSIYRDSKAVNKVRMDMRPKVKNIVRTRTVSTSEINQKSENKTPHRISLGKIQEQNQMKGSIGEIEKLKRIAKGKDQHTPRPNYIPVENNNKNEPHEYSGNRKMFKKKEENSIKTHTIQSHTKDVSSSNVDINESINSRKDRINQLLSRYGKNKEGKHNFGNISSFIFFYEYLQKNNYELYPINLSNS